jgi:prefoldin subunit 5
MGRNSNSRRQILPRLWGKRLAFVNENFEKGDAIGGNSGESASEFFVTISNKEKERDGDSTTQADDSLSSASEMQVVNLQNALVGLGARYKVDRYMDSLEIERLKEENQKYNQKLQLLDKQLRELGQGPRTTSTAKLDTMEKEEGQDVVTINDITAKMQDLTFSNHKRLTSLWKRQLNPSVSDRPPSDIEVFDSSDASALTGHEILSYQEEYNSMVEHRVTSRTIYHDTIKEIKNQNDMIIARIHQKKPESDSLVELDLD